MASQTLVLIHMLILSKRSAMGLINWSICVDRFSQ